MHPPGRDIVDLSKATVVIRCENWEWVQHIMKRYGSGLILAAAIEQGAAVTVQDTKRARSYRGQPAGKRAPKAVN